MKFDINLHAKNLLITDRLNDYVMKKIPKLDRYLGGIIDARVDLSYVKSAREAKDRNVAQITVRGSNFLLRAEERTDDIFSSFDAALDKLKRRIERYKGKRNHRAVKKGVDRMELGYEGDDEDVEFIDVDIVRRKKFNLKPMSEREAIEQMNLLGHEDFFLFFNADTDEVNVLYRRRNGGYGIIEVGVD